MFELARRRCRRPSLSTAALLVSSFLFILALAAGAQAIPGNPLAYAITDLDAQAGARLFPRAINNAGQVAGAWIGDNAYHAFVYDKSGRHDLGTLGGPSSEALALNDAGQVVGWSYIGSSNNGVTPQHAFLYSNGVMRDLGTLGGANSRALGINASGQVVGESEVSSTGGTAPKHAFLYDGTGMHDLGTLAGYVDSHAVAINSSGLVAGFEQSDVGPLFAMHSFLYDGTAMREPGALLDVKSTINALNDAGQVVGTMGPLEANSFPARAFLYDDTGLHDLGTLGGRSSNALSINASGQIAGQSETVFHTTHAFIYSGGTMRDLTSLIVNNPGWLLDDARGINDSGQIVGLGRFGGEVKCWLLTPIHGPAINVSPSTMMFDRQTLGTSSDARTVLLTNLGDAPLTISSIAIPITQEYGISSDTGEASLAPGASRSLGIRFTPAGVGARNGRLVIQSDAVNGRQVVVLMGGGTGPLVHLSPTRLEFGSQAVGTSNDAQAISLYNAGDAPLDVQSVKLTGDNPGDFSVATDGWTGAHLLPGEIVTLNVRFSPAAVGPRGAALAVTDSASGSPHTVALAGTGVAAVASLSAGSVSFADQVVGTSSAEQTVVLTNTGSVPLIVGTLNLTGATPDEFIAALDPGALALAPGESRNLRIRFQPRAPGPRAATLLVNDNTGASPEAVTLTGTGTTPEVTFSISRLSGPGSIGFGSVALGTFSSAQTLTLTNTGTAPLVISRLALAGANAGDYWITADSGGSSLAPGAARTITLRFTPAALGARSASLTLTDNAGGGQQSIALSGTGVLPAAGSRGRALIPNRIELLIAQIEGADSPTPPVNSHGATVVSAGQHISLKVLIKFPNGATADVTDDQNTHLAARTPVGKFTSKNVWCPGPGDAGRTVTLSGTYRSPIGGKRLVGTVTLTVKGTRRGRG